MRRKRWLRSNPASATRVAVRSELPWRVKAVLMLAAMVLVALIVAASLIAYNYSRTSTPSDAAPLTAEVEEIRADAKQAIAERDRKLALVAQLENQQRVDRAAAEQVQAQLRALENENARLKEDLSFFESLLPTPTNAKGVVIRSFRLQALNDSEREKVNTPGAVRGRRAVDAPQALRYRLLVQQSGRPERDFVGAVSLTVSLQQGGRPWILQLPDAAIPDAGPQPLAFRHYQRVEGTFELPEGAVVRSVLVKIQSNGEVRTQQTFTM
jgi:methionine-rich copper-binding protein CopC